MIGYLSPEGEFFPCESWGHRSKAYEICEEKFDESLFSGWIAEKYLLSLGYLVIRSEDAFMEYYDDNRNIILLTDEQISWLTKNTNMFNEGQKKDMNEILFDQEDLRKRRTKREI